MVVINKKEGRDEIGVAVYTVLRKAEWRPAMKSQP